MNIKGFVLIALSLIVVVGVVLVGCAAPAPAPTPTPAPAPAPTPTPAPAPPKPEEPTTFKMAGVPPQWVSSRLQESLVAEVISTFTPYGIKIVSKPGEVSEERFDALMMGDVMITRDLVGYSVLKETYPLQASPEALARFNYLGFFPYQIKPYPLITTTDIQANSLSEVIDKKIPLKIGTSDGASYWFVDQLWEILGAPDGVDSVVDWGGMVEQQTSGTDHGSLFREAVINASMWMGVSYYAYFEEVNSVRPLQVLSVAEDEADLKKIQAEYPEVLRWVMTKDWYTFVKQDTPMIAALLVYMASPRASEELVYNITKALWEQRDFLSRGSRQFNECLSEDTVKQMVDLVPLHPGAAKYWKEIGLMK